ncbi:hypothetical protein CVT24_000100 [Panaeolus cyanescens]|uniref:Meiotically up-regulated protein Msb1/Mug8 domain-containing protein n=1 Tax=Panaeolus cyanescens TaxID=181874 RepID=A0A409VS51_9AGAR|nr:hypothetical protein CVT24_000100 [Panaeolus cyanescens]
MQSFLSKVFGRKKDDKDVSPTQLSPGELLGERFEAISPNVSPGAAQFLELDPKVNAGEASKDPGFTLFRAKSRPSSPQTKPKRHDTLPQLSLAFLEPNGPLSPAADFVREADPDMSVLLSDAIIGQRKLNPLEALILIRACSQAIIARGLETLGVMHPHWYSASPDVQRRLISQFINSLNADSTTSPTSSSPTTAFESEMTFTRPHDVAAVLRWGLRHLQLDGDHLGKDETWYSKFLEAEAAADYPLKAFSEQLAPHLPPAHLEVLTSTLEIFSSLAAHAEANSTSGSKLSKIFGLWLLVSQRVDSKDDFHSFYQRWERMGRMLEHLFLARIRDDSADRRMPVRLLELVRQYPYTKGLSNPMTDVKLLARPRITTIPYDALFVRLEVELVSEKRRPKHRINPLTLLADAFSVQLEGEHANLWNIITSESKNGSSPSPLSNVFADETIRFLSMVPGTDGPDVPVKSPSLSIFAGGVLSPHKRSATAIEKGKGKPAPTIVSGHVKPATDPTPVSALSPLDLTQDWDQFSTSGFFEVSPAIVPLASTLFDNDVEKTVPPDPPAPLSRSLSRMSSRSKRSKHTKSPSTTSPRKSEDTIRPPQTDSPSPAPAPSPPAQDLLPLTKATNVQVIQIDEAFVDFWSDALLDPIASNWPTFIICKFKSSLVPKLVIGVAEEGKAAKTLKWLIIEHVYTVKPPLPPAPVEVAVARPRASSPSSDSMSPKKRFSFWSMNRSISGSSVGSQKGKNKLKSPVAVGEMGELLEEGSSSSNSKSPISRIRKSLDISRKPTESPTLKKAESMAVIKEAAPVVAAAGAAVGVVAVASALAEEKKDEDPSPPIAEVVEEAKPDAVVDEAGAPEAESTQAINEESNAALESTPAEAQPVAERSKDEEADLSTPPGLETDTQAADVPQAEQPTQADQVLEAHVVPPVEATPSSVDQTNVDAVDVEGAKEDLPAVNESEGLQEAVAVPAIEAEESAQQTPVDVQSDVQAEKQLEAEATEPIAGPEETTTVLAQEIIEPASVDVAHDETPVTQVESSEPPAVLQADVSTPDQQEDVAAEVVDETPAETVVVEDKPTEVAPVEPVSEVQPEPESTISQESEQTDAAENHNQAPSPPVLQDDSVSLQQISTEAQPETLDEGQPDVEDSVTAPVVAPEEPTVAAVDEKVEPQAVEVAPEVSPAPEAETSVEPSVTVQDEAVAHDQQQEDTVSTQVLLDDTPVEKAVSNDDAVIENGVAVPEVVATQESQLSLLTEPAPLPNEDDTPPQAREASSDAQPEIQEEQAEVKDTDPVTAHQEPAVVEPQAEIVAEKESPVVDNVPSGEQSEPLEGRDSTPTPQDQEEEVQVPAQALEAAIPADDAVTPEAVNDQEPQPLAESEDPAPAAPITSANEDEAPLPQDANPIDSETPEEVSPEVEGAEPVAAPQESEVSITDGTSEPQSVDANPEEMPVAEVESSAPEPQAVAPENEAPVEKHEIVADHPSEEVPTQIVSEVQPEPELNNEVAPPLATSETQALSEDDVVVAEAKVESAQPDHVEDEQPSEQPAQEAKPIVPDATDSAPVPSSAEHDDQQVAQEEVSETSAPAAVLSEQIEAAESEVVEESQPAAVEVAVVEPVQEASPIPESDAVAVEDEPLDSGSLPATVESTIVETSTADEVTEHADDHTVKLEVSTNDTEVPEADLAKDLTAESITEAPAAEQAPQEVIAQDELASPQEVAEVNDHPSQQTEAHESPIPPSSELPNEDAVEAPAVSIESSAPEATTAVDVEVAPVVEASESLAQADTSAVESNVELEAQPETVEKHDAVEELATEKQEIDKEEVQPTEVSDPLAQPVPSPENQEESVLVDAAEGVEEEIIEQVQTTHESRPSDEDKATATVDEVPVTEAAEVVPNAEASQLDETEAPADNLERAAAVEEESPVTKANDAVVQAETLEQPVIEPANNEAATVETEVAQAANDQAIPAPSDAVVVDEQNSETEVVPPQEPAVLPSVPSSEVEQIPAEEPTPTAQEEVAVPTTANAESVPVPDMSSAEKVESSEENVEAHSEAVENVVAEEPSVEHTSQAIVDQPSQESQEPQEGPIEVVGIEENVQNAEASPEVAQQQDQTSSEPVDVAVPNVEVAFKEEPTVSETDSPKDVSQAEQISVLPSPTPDTLPQTNDDNTQHAEVAAEVVPDVHINAEQDKEDTVVEEASAPVLEEVEKPAPQDAFAPADEEEKDEVPVSSTTVIESDTPAAESNDADVTKEDASSTNVDQETSAANEVSSPAEDAATGTEVVQSPDEGAATVDPLVAAQESLPEETNAVQDLDASVTEVQSTDVDVVPIPDEVEGNKETGDVTVVEASQPGDDVKEITTADSETPSDDSAPVADKEPHPEEPVVPETSETVVIDDVKPDVPQDDSLTAEGETAIAKEEVPQPAEKADENTEDVSTEPLPAVETLPIVDAESPSIPAASPPVQEQDESSPVAQEPTIVDEPAMEVQPIASTEAAPAVVEETPATEQDNVQEPPIAEVAQTPVADAVAVEEDKSETIDAPPAPQVASEEPPAPQEEPVIDQSPVDEATSAPQESTVAVETTEASVSEPETLPAASETPDLVVPGEVIPEPVATESQSTDTSDAPVLEEDQQTASVPEPPAQETNGSATVEELPVSEAEPVSENTNEVQKPSLQEDILVTEDVSTPEPAKETEVEAPSPPVDDKLPELNNTETQDASVPVDSTPEVPTSTDQNAEQVPDDETQKPALREDVPVAEDVSTSEPAKETDNHQEVEVSSPPVEDKLPEVHNTEVQETAESVASPPEVTPSIEQNVEQGLAHVDEPTTPTPASDVPEVSQEVKEEAGSLEPTVEESAKTEKAAPAESESAKPSSPEEDAQPTEARQESEVVVEEEQTTPVSEPPSVAEEVAAVQAVDEPSTKEPSVESVPEESVKPSEQLEDASKPQESPSPVAASEAVEETKADTVVDKVVEVVNVLSELASPTVNGESVASDAAEFLASGAEKQALLEETNGEASQTAATEVVSPKDDVADTPKLAEPYNNLPEAANATDD